MADSFAHLVLSRTVAIGGHSGTGRRPVAGAGGPGDVIDLITGLLLIKVGTGVEERYNFVHSHIDLQKEAYKGKARAVSKVDSFGHIREHLLDARGKRTHLCFSEIHPIPGPHGIQLLFQRLKIFLERLADPLVHGNGQPL